MLCARAGSHHKCGQCVPCRINARRIWAARIMLEAQHHAENCFATLTYEEQPLNGSVHKTHLQSTLKRLRTLVDRELPGSRQIRFFGVGEYGDSTQRPHYHAALFGIGPQHAPLIERAWSGLRDHPATAGFVHVGLLNADSASYVASYCTKKLTKADDARLGGRNPEFALMSRRPGVGAASFPALVDALNTSDGALYIARHHDVPAAFNVGGRLMPLGHFMRSRLRMFFFGDDHQPQAAKEARDAQLKHDLSQLLPALQVDPGIFERISSLSAEEEEIRFNFQQRWIQQQEMKRTQRTKQISGKHKINLSRKRI